MHVFCAVHVDRSLYTAMTPAEREAFDNENTAFAQWLATGPGVSFASLHEPETATLVRSREGKVSMTDGPYVETKEHLAGFILLRVRDVAEAIDIVMSRCPVARIGTLEVREANLPD